MNKKGFQAAVSAKIGEVMKTGVRRNTHAPVSKSNPRRKVSQKQAIAIALNSQGRGKSKK